MKKQSEFLGLNAVTVNEDDFWGRIMEKVRVNVIPYQWEVLNDLLPDTEPSYCMRNFKIAAQITHPELNYNVDNNLGHGGMRFQDSDFAKWIEAVAYSLVWHPDQELEKKADSAIDIVCHAQQKDGYLNTFYIINGLEKRFTNLTQQHELYCYGHFLEGAIAYYEATGKRKLLDALIAYTDCVDRLIGPEDGKIHGYPGHEIAEMALIRLYAITKDKMHLKLAKYFIDQRGQKPLFFEKENKENNNTFYWKDSYFQYQYYQAGKPVRDQHIAEGHAVRAVYLYSGMADVARLTGDEELLQTCEGLFTNISQKQMYITGGIGQSDYGEAFSFDYDLPNDTAYAETCASIGLAFFARRMASITPKSKYGDILEKTLYNGILSGMSMDGMSFFYVNPLEVLPEAILKDHNMHHVKIERQKWFACACCPPNLARIITSLGSYVHSKNDDTIYTHLYIGSTAKFKMKGKNVNLKLDTSLPWDNKVEISFKHESNINFTYGFRIPSWCGKFNVTLNNTQVDYTLADGFALIDREWKGGDKLVIVFDMPVTLTETNPNVRQNTGKAALIRGPIVYCLEEADNGKGLFKLRLNLSDPIDAEVNFNKDLLEGLTTITLNGKKVKDWSEDELYRPAEDAKLDDQLLRFIPYYAWGNRGPGEMIVWVNK